MYACGFLRLKGFQMMTITYKNGRKFVHNFPVGKYLLAAVIKYIEKNTRELLNGLLFLIIWFFFFFHHTVLFLNLFLSLENTNIIFPLKGIDQVNLPTEMSKGRVETWARHAILLMVHINQLCMFKMILSKKKKKRYFPNLVFKELRNLHL